MASLVIKFADLASEPIGTGRDVTAEVLVTYTREVPLTDGTVLQAVPTRKQLGAGGTAIFEVTPADDSTVVEAHRGFGLRVEWLLTHRAGRGRQTETRGARTVKVTAADGATVQFGTLLPIEPVPAKYTSIADYAAGLVGDLVTDEMSTWDRIQQDVGTGRLYFAAPPLPPIFADDFDRPDESPVGPTPVGVKPFVNGAAPNAGTWGVVGGQLAPLTVAGTNSAGMWNSGQSDGVLRVTVADTGYVSPYHGAHMTFRSDDAAVSNGWIIIGTGAGSGAQYVLRRRVGGSYSTSYDVGLVSQPANGDQFEITLDGSQITVKINGVTRHEAAYPELSDMGVYHGVGAYTGRSGVRFDNVSFEQIGA